MKLNTNKWGKIEISATKLISDICKRSHNNSINIS